MENMRVNMFGPSLTEKASTFAPFVSKNTYMFVTVRRILDISVYLTFLAG